MTLRLSLIFGGDYSTFLESYVKKLLKQFLKNIPWSVFPICHVLVPINNNLFDSLSLFLSGVCVCMCMCCLVAESCLTLFVTPWTVAHQAPLSMEFSRQEYWSGLPFPSPRILLTQGWSPCLLHWQVDALPLSHQGSPCMCLHVCFFFFSWSLFSYFYFLLPCYSKP